MNFEIDINFTGGNIIVTEIDGDNVKIDRDLRDTSRKNWFYWAFRVKNAGGRTLRFTFPTHHLVGFYGAAVSHDLKGWQWSEDCQGGGDFDSSFFTYTFREDENEVYFAHDMLYHPDRFFEFAKNRGLDVKALCTSVKGNGVPCVEFGEGEKVIMLTARHHCCEATGSYVLEGVIDGLLGSLPDGYRVFSVPFVDYEGVVAGDQGKDRIPHDHARDYTDAPIYPEVAAIMEYARAHDVAYGFDFHSPYHGGEGNDFVYMIKKFESKLDELNKFGDLLAFEVTEDSLPYRREWDYEPGGPYNYPDIPNFVCFLHKRGAELTFTLETAYFGRPGVLKFSQSKAIELGKAFARAVLEYIK